MLIQQSFERWLQNFHPKLRIMSHATNPDIDVLYLGKERLCSVPKGLKKASGWGAINDKRSDEGYTTSDGIAHRSLAGVGLKLLQKKIISPRQFIKNFATARNEDWLEKTRLKYKE